MWIIISRRYSHLLDEQPGWAGGGGGQLQQLQPQQQHQQLQHQQQQLHQQQHFFVRGLGSQMAPPRPKNRVSFKNFLFMHFLLPCRWIPSLGIKSVRNWRPILDTLTQGTGHISIFSLWTFDPILRPPTIVYLHLRTPTCCQRSSAWSRRSTDQASKLLSSPPGLQTSNNQNWNPTKQSHHHTIYIDGPICVKLLSLPPSNTHKFSPSLMCTIYQTRRPKYQFHKYQKDHPNM